MKFVLDVHSLMTVAVSPGRKDTTATVGITRSTDFRKLRVELLPQKCVQLRFDLVDSEQKTK